MPAGNESRMSQPSFTPQSCSCNSTTGPCPGHFEKMHAQVVAETTSPLSLHQQHQWYQQHQNHHVPNSDVSISPQPHQTPLSWSSFSKSRCVLFLFTNLLYCRTWGKVCESRSTASQAKCPFSHIVSRAHNLCTSVMEAME